MKLLKQWLLNKVLVWFPTERVAAFALNKLLDRSSNRERARWALKIATRVLEAARATVAALKALLADEVTMYSVNEMRDSVERAAVSAWAAGELTPPEARHLKEREDATT